MSWLNYIEKTIPKFEYILLQEHATYLQKSEELPLCHPYDQMPITSLCFINIENSILIVYINYVGVIFYSLSGVAVNTDFSI